jgi:hypothetical protein
MQQRRSTVQPYLLMVEIQLEKKWAGYILFFQKTHDPGYPAHIAGILPVCFGIFW